MYSVILRKDIVSYEHLKAIMKTNYTYVYMTSSSVNLLTSQYTEVMHILAVNILYCLFVHLCSK